MTPLAEKFGLGPDQFAILFETSLGIEADDLGTFLKRAATLARREGVELRVVRFETGSLATIFRAVGKAAKKEFMKAPIDATLKATGIVGAVAAAFTWSFDVDSCGPTPVAKAGATVVEEKQVSKITLITQHDSVLLMDESIARRVRRAERTQAKTPRLAAPEPYRQIAEQALGGSLTGEILDVKGEPHFRPEGYRFLVPIDLNSGGVGPRIMRDTFVRVAGEIHMVKGRPDRIVIDEVTVL